jgi:HD-like signal output (HDOD) protein
MNTSNTSPMTTLLELYQNVESTLEGMDIPPRPRILDLLLQEVQKSEPDFRTLAMLISEDVSLSASLIKTVNSPFFGLQRKIASVHNALVVLGLEVAARMIAGILLRHVFPKRPDLEEWWDASIKVALMSQWVASQLEPAEGVQPPDAYTFGLFRDCGMAIMLMKKRDYRQILAQARDENSLDFTEVEQARYGVHHAVVGSKLAYDWRLPDDMAWAILSHHTIAGSPLPQPDELTAAGLRMIALSQLADHLLQKNNRLLADREWDKLGGTCLEALAIDAEGLESLRAEAARFIENDLSYLIIA